jgi:NADH dehydrogenase (ubiquinone) 1 alpha subcomplex subunit 13
VLCCAVLTFVVIGSELAREKMWSRIHLIPMLQAEEDRDQVRRHFADKAREKELLGGETKVYHSDRYVFFFFFYFLSLFSKTRS